MKQEILDIDYVGPVLEIARHDLGFDFKPFLQEKEEILWAGKPNTKQQSWWGIGMLGIFGILMLIIFFLSPFGMIGIVFVGVIYHQGIILPARYLRKSFYCITTLHCIVSNTYGGPTLKRMKVKNMSALKRDKTFKGHGTIRMNGKISRSRIGPSIAPTSAWSLEFERIPEVEAVYNLLKNHEEYSEFRIPNQ